LFRVTFIVVYTVRKLCSVQCKILRFFKPFGGPVNDQRLLSFEQQRRQVSDRRLDRKMRLSYVTAQLVGAHRPVQHGGAQTISAFLYYTIRNIVTFIWQLTIIYYAAVYNVYIYIYYKIYIQYTL